jgi:hypothetical protein
MFFHAENQRLLFETLQKSPYFIEFSQKYANEKEGWFVIASDKFCKTKMISVDAANDARSLLEINKQALQFMIADLKRLLGYSDASNPITIPMPIAYNISVERQERDDRWTKEFSSYQEEYNRLLAPPIRPETVFSSETDEKIKNMDELLAEQVKRRTAEYAEFMPTPPSQDSSSSSGSFATQKNTGSIRLKIMEDIDRVEMDRTSTKVRFSDQIEQCV